ncbi:MAG: hydroxymethylpyrimidine/phosphomethylpyrimidine kinase [Cytophagaceae bacterium]|nr:hydroxymethylpyrimidine/phosphomethylpyrimidine kinase [Cytophagaceae bacterium]MDW8456895.1 hydroxymethylpyrimidine/phosphomethylpyrimidine kinase [Cytophagaceae bacterium]
MKKNKRPYVLSIAGFDPCAGAGVLADIKTFEAHKVYGLGVVTGITYQNEFAINGIDWMNTDQIISQTDVLISKYKIATIKIGLMKNIAQLREILAWLKEKKTDMKIIWDPILKSSSGYVFHDHIQKEEWFEICRQIFLITPNTEEATAITGEDDPIRASDVLSAFTHVYLKGGHSYMQKGRDYLFTKKEKSSLANVKNFRPSKKPLKEKHGSGCVLSSAIAANLARGYPLHRACLMAKQYTERFLASNDGLLGYHKL